MDPIMLAIASAAIAAGSTIGKIFYQNKAATSQKDAINLQMEENKLITQQKTLSNYDTLQNVLETQQAQLTTRGVTGQGGSFEAIQRESVNRAAKEQKNIEMESSLRDYNLRTEKKNVNDQLFANIFGDIASFGINAATLASNTPSKKNYAPVEEPTPSWSRG